jgi:hypothetical protein
LTATTIGCNKLSASEAPDPGRHHVGTPGDIISECPGDFIGIRIPAAVRMRLHRKRRREGTHYVRIPLESFEIEGLIRLKVLPKAHREDADALQAAVLTLVYQALDGAG